jgi:hypothetical protein
MEWDPELIGNTSCIVGCIQRTAALPACINAIGSRVEAHPDTNNIMTLLNKQGGGK